MDRQLPKVFVAEDEPSGLVLFQLALKDKFELKTATDGIAALTAIKSFLPAVVLLDVNMPGKNGYEVCKQLKEDAATRDAIIIFVSGADSIEERMHGYAVGGDDYVTKPFDPVELAAKVTRAVAVRQAMSQLAQEAGMAKGMATEVMANMGELGIVLLFMRNMFISHSYEDVARHLVAALRGYRLPAVLKIRGVLGCFEIGTSGIIKPLESELIDKLATGGRICDFEGRTIFNYGRVSILIKMMPTDNKEFYGRIKDHAAILAEGADARVATLDMDETIRIQRVALEGVIRDTQKTIGDTNQVYRALKLKNTSIMRELLQKVEDLYMSLGLSEIQEERLSRVINSACDQSSALYDEDLAVSAQLANIQQRLQEVLNFHK
ncbi:MAG: response regulator [Gammaproteobacteria bacterium]|nr:response regulator [Gammaproteobacteria bacterium]